MIQLSREIRFALVNDYDPAITNSWSGWPATTLVVPQLVLTCVVEGSVDPRTGYICNIKDLDRLLRDVITERIIPSFSTTDNAATLLREIHQHCQKRWTSSVNIVRQTLHLNPFLKFTICTPDTDMMELTQQFEFSAAHRLHCEELSDDENRRIFGKCNNPAGHGHNYVVEVSIAGNPDVHNSPLIGLCEFETTVKELVVDRLDHKNLNVDIDDFADLNPSVENITKVIWQWLTGQFGAAQLTNVRVYETPKTWAQYSGR